MTLNIGDRVRFVEDYSANCHKGTTATVTQARASLFGAGGVQIVDLDVDGVSTGASAYSYRLEKIEDEGPRPLGLAVGDKVVNLRTGREGYVLKGPVSGVLKVYDTKPSIRGAVPAQALEEYEFHHPGTYDVWRRPAIMRGRAQPW